jgi:hypothetical protein
MQLYLVEFKIAIINYTHPVYFNIFVMVQSMVMALLPWYFIEIPAFLGQK